MKRLLGSGILHTKFIIADNRSFYLGSANMDWRSLTQVCTSTVDRGSIGCSRGQRCPAEQFYDYPRNFLNEWDGVQQDCCYVRVGFCRADCNKCGNDRISHRYS